MEAPLCLSFWLQAAKVGKDQFPVQVRLHDKRYVTLNIDSGTNSKEVCTEVLKQLQLKDTYGYACALETGDKVSLSHGVW